MRRRHQPDLAGYPARALTRAKMIPRMLTAATPDSSHTANSNVKRGKYTGPLARRLPLIRENPVGVGGATLLWTIFVILLIAWLLGLVGVYQIGSLVWLLFVAAIIALVVQLATGRRTVL